MSSSEFDPQMSVEVAGVKAPSCLHRLRKVGLEETLGGHLVQLLAQDRIIPILTALQKCFSNEFLKL